MYQANRGDYDIGMPQWGGPSALRDYIKLIRTRGFLPTFYVEGILACATTRVAKEFASTYAVMDPDWKDAYKCPKCPKGYVGSWASYNMCPDNEWWPSYLAATVARVCRETGIDGLRLDEYGHRGYVCTNTRHKHIFAEPGHNAWMQAVARTCRLVHKAMDETRPGLVLMTEYPGNDHLAATIEAAIVHEVTPRHVVPIRPVPCNLFRFYFPHCKLFEINRRPGRVPQAWNLWNATGGFSTSGQHTPAAYTVLVENTDTFEGEVKEPLVPTLIPRVYANRFEGGGKTILTIHNGRGHTVDAPVIAVEPDDDHHFVELLSGREMRPMPFEKGHALRFKLRRDATVVVAQLARRLIVAGGRVRILGESKGLTIVTASADGSRLAPLANGESLPSWHGPRGTVMVKLLRGKLLVDAVPFVVGARR